MKRLLLVSVFLNPLVFAQGVATFTYAGPTLSPPKNPSCSVSPFVFSQSATYSWQTGCGDGSTSAGTLSATGTGYCSGIPGIGLCLANPGQPRRSSVSVTVRTRLAPPGSITLI